jgi:hypothetical protein
MLVERVFRGGGLTSVEWMVISLVFTCVAKGCLLYTPDSTFQQSTLQRFGGLNTVFFFLIGRGNVYGFNEGNQLSITISAVSAPSPPPSAHSAPSPSPSSPAPDKPHIYPVGPQLTRSSSHHQHPLQEGGSWLAPACPHLAGGT